MQAAFDEVLEGRQLPLGNAYLDVNVISRPVDELPAFHPSRPCTDARCDER